MSQRDVNAITGRLSLRPPQQESLARLRAYYEAPTNGRSALDDLSRELKRLVRDFANELAQIDSLGGK